MYDRKQQAGKRGRTRSTILWHSHKDVTSATQLGSPSQSFRGLPRIVPLAGDKTFALAMAGHFTI